MSESSRPQLRLREEGATKRPRQYFYSTDAHTPYFSPLQCGWPCGLVEFFKMGECQPRPVGHTYVAVCLNSTRWEQHAAEWTWGHTRHPRSDSASGKRGPYRQRNDIKVWRCRCRYPGNHSKFLQLLELKIYKMRDCLLDSAAIYHGANFD